MPKPVAAKPVSELSEDQHAAADELEAALADQMSVNVMRSSLAAVKGLISALDNKEDPTVYDRTDWGAVEDLLDCLYGFFFDGSLFDRLSAQVDARVQAARGCIVRPLTPK